MKLKYLDECNDKRRALADRYRKNLGDTDYRIPEEMPDRRHVYHLLIAGCTDKEAVKKALKDADIGFGEHYPIAVYLQPAFSDLGIGEGSFPIAERWMREHVSLPMFPELTLEKVDAVCDVLKKAQ